MPAAVIAPPEAALTLELAAISAFDGMIRQIQADQYRRVERARALAAEVEGITDESTGSQRDLAARSFVAELATTLGQHEASAARLVAEAARLTGPRAATLAALERGELGLTQVRSVLELTQALSPEVADGTVSTNAEVRRRMRRARERLHLETLADRRARAVDERRVCVDPAPDGMGWLSVYLEAERALAITQRLDALAAREASGDTRTTTPRAADLVADLLVGGALSDDERTHAGATGAVQPRVNVTVPVMTLLGLSDESAELEGYGPIDADTARRLAAHAPSMRRIGSGAQLRPRALPGAGRPRWLRAHARWAVPVPGLRAPSRYRRPRPHSRVGARRSDRGLESRLALPPPPPLEARERMARGARTRRGHALDVTGGAPAAHDSRAAVHAGRGR